MPAIIAPTWPRDPNFPSVLQGIFLPSCRHRLDPLTSLSAASWQDLQASCQCRRPRHCRYHRRDSDCPPPFFTSKFLPTTPSTRLPIDIPAPPLPWFCILLLLLASRPFLLLPCPLDHPSCSSIFFLSQPVTNISFPHRHPNNSCCLLRLHRKKSPRQKEEGQRSHAGKGDGVFKSAFRHDFLLTASSGLWALHSNRCSGIHTKPQVHVQSRQCCTQTKRKEQGYLVMPAALLDLTHRSQ